MEVEDGDMGKDIKMNGARRVESRESLIWANYSSEIPDKQERTRETTVGGV